MFLFICLTKESRGGERVRLQVEQTPIRCEDCVKRDVRKPRKDKISTEKAADNEQWRRIIAEVSQLHPFKGNYEEEDNGK